MRTFRYIRMVLGSVLLAGAMLPGAVAADSPTAASATNTPPAQPRTIWNMLGMRESPLRAFMPAKEAPAVPAPLPADLLSERLAEIRPAAPMPKSATEQPGTLADSTKPAAKNVSPASYSATPGVVPTAPMPAMNDNATESAPGRVVLRLIVLEHRDPPGAKSSIVSDEASQAEPSDARPAASQGVIPQ